MRLTNPWISIPTAATILALSGCVNRAPTIVNAGEKSLASCPEGQVRQETSCVPDYEKEIQQALKDGKDKLKIVVDGKVFNLQFGQNNKTWFGRTNDGKDRLGGANTQNNEPVFRSFFETPGVEQTSTAIQPDKFVGVISFLPSDLTDVASFKGGAIGLTNCGGEGKYKLENRKILATGSIEKKEKGVKIDVMTGKDVGLSQSNPKTVRFEGLSNTGAVCQWFGVPGSKEFQDIQQMREELKIEMIKETSGSTTI